MSLTPIPKMRFSRMEMGSPGRSEMKLLLTITRSLCIGSCLFFAQASLDAQSTHDPASIVISKDDVAMLGGWPIERRWYAIVLERLRAAGAKRIFIDIAFPSSDILHPESDGFFFQKLERMPDVYLLSDDTRFDATQNIVLGTRRLASRRFVAPFSKSFSFHNGILEFNPGEGALTDFFLPKEFTHAEITVDFPAEEIRSDYSFRQALQGQLSCAGKDVVISLDYPGITSYIVGPGSEVVSTSALQLWTIRQIEAGKYWIRLPLWETLLFACIILVPVAIGVASRRKGLWPGIISAALWLIVLGFLSALRIRFNAWWCLALAPGAGFLLVQFISRWKEARVSIGSARSELSAEHQSDDTETVQDLQHRLDYYERLSNQIPVSELGQGVELHGILCHKESPVVEVLRKAEMVAKNDIPVLIRGESGTGKEMLAQFIHANSGRRDRPIIAVNCGALNDNLIEAELFGYEKGAFTGAFQQKPGRFELADGGTLFLDEVSETSLAFQVKLLRVLQEGVIERVGGTKTIPVSVRVIAATHQDLKRAIHKKMFREDLFYRLNGYDFVLPPLRERPMDVEYLFKHFLFEIDRDLKYSEPLIEWLKSQPWPGNVRQLKAATRRAVINAQLRKRSFLIPKDFELLETEDGLTGTMEQLAEQILQKLRGYEFQHRSISAVASDLMIHRSTVTEYLRGWTVKYLNAGEWNRDFVLASLRGTAPVSDEAQLKKRVDEYVEYIESRIVDGLRNQQTDEQILGGKFRNLPVAFRNDLAALVRKKRMEIRGSGDD
jgi:DNA-binding NtrC family response regulator